MNSQWAGDSYDIVKRFFVQVLRSMDYEVYLDPMFTGAWQPAEVDRFGRLVDAFPPGPRRREPSALLIDPDTGIAERDKKTHVSFTSIAARANEYALLVVFDQSFSRGLPSHTSLDGKLRRLHEQGLHAFYYDSHARFLFCSREAGRLLRVRRKLEELGLPPRRLVGLNQDNS